MTENKRFTFIHFDWLQWHIYDNESLLCEVTDDEDAENLCKLLNELHYENYNLELHSKSQSKAYHKLLDSFTRLKRKNKELKDKYERKDRQLKRTKKDIEKYTDYFMNELNWDCDRIIKEVFR